MKLTRQEARELDKQNEERVLKNIHKQMLKNGNKNRLFSELKQRYPYREIFGMKFPEYVAMLEEEIQQENTNK